MAGWINRRIPHTQSLITGLIVQVYFSLRCIQGTVSCVPYRNQWDLGVGMFWTGRESDVIEQGAPGSQAGCVCLGHNLAQVKHF